MGWTIVFIVSWVMFLLLVDVKRLKYTIWTGLTAILLQFFVDTAGAAHKLYSITDPVIKLQYSSALFTLGPVLTVGILIAQFHPSKAWFRAANIVVIGVLYTLQEYVLYINGYLRYLDWDIFNSIVVNFPAMMVFSWVAILTDSFRKECNRK